MQKSFSDLEYAAKEKLTRRDRFLAAFNKVSIWASILEFPNVAVYSYSAHSCCGTGATKCVTIANPVPGGPPPLKQDNSNLVKYRGGILLE